MKKLTQARKIWLARHAIRSASRRHNAKEINSIRRLVVGYRYGQKSRVWVARDARSMPRVLCFEDNYEETVTFFNALGADLVKSAASIRFKIKNRYKPLKWCDFSTLEFISPSAALVLAAEYERSKLLSKADGLFTINMDDWHPGPRQTLIDLGMLALLDIDAPKEVERGEKHIVQFRSDTQVILSKASRTLKDVINLAASASILTVEDETLTNFRTFLLAIGEAINNTSDHAYPQNIPTDLTNVGRWWITGAVDPQAKLLTFAVYDQGVSIPRAIPHGKRFESVSRFFKRLSGAEFDPEDTAQDGRAIAAAVRGGMSGTGLEHRGRGMGLMRDYIHNERSGRLRIISRHGDFVACSGRKDRHRVRTVPLRGTLVEWTVNL